ncbi:amidohydrolase [Alkalihalobacillus sp. 1P02AB]|uniref:amidohydrolase n=1 Tax=Alkalihalobacillus sp. 1P02AB TaxID=3132260 RepID=UPI0039A5D168
MISLSFIIKNVKIISIEQKTVIDGYLEIDGKIIKKVHEGEPSLEIVNQASRVIDGKGKWLLPGFVNTHTHVGMNLLRGYSDELPLQRWLQEKMWPFEAKLDRASVAAARRLALVEMIKSGTTTFLEMYHLFMDDFAEEIQDVGIRATLMRSMIGLCPTDEQEAKLKEAKEFAINWHQKAEGRIQTMLAPHAPYTCPPNFIKRIVEEAAVLQLPVHMHLAETKKEVDDHMNQYGLHPVHHLDQLGVLKEVDWLFAHGVFLEDEHLEVLQSAKSVSISHNPISNLKLGSGIAAVSKWQQYDLNICLGTDSVASNNTLDMVEEMRMAALIHKGIERDPTAVPSIDALHMATLNGINALQFEEVKGIKEGGEADFVLINGNQAHLQPEKQIFSHLVYALNSQDITDVYVQGVALMENKQLLTLDEEKIIYEANREFRQVISRL